MVRRCARLIHRALPVFTLAAVAGVAAAAVAITSLISSQMLPSPVSALVVRPARETPPSRAGIESVAPVAVLDAVAMTDPLAQSAADDLRSARAAAAVASRDTPRDLRTLARVLAGGRGWNDTEAACLVRLWDAESGFDPLAGDPVTGPYGIPQAQPGASMASAGEDWETNPLTQIEWGLDDVATRFGTPCSAWTQYQATLR